MTTATSATHPRPTDWGPEQGEEEEVEDIALCLSGVLGSWETWQGLCRPLTCLYSPQMNL